MAESQDDIWKQSERTHRSPWFLVSPIDGWIPVFDGRYTVPKTTSLSDYLPIIPLLYPHCIYLYIYIFPSLNVITIPTFNGYTVIQLNSHSKHMCFDAPPPTCCYSQCISCGQSTASRRIVGFPGSPGIRWWLVSVLWKLSCFQNHKTHLNIEEQCLCNCGPGVCVCHCVSLCVTVCHCVSLSFLYIGYCRYLQILELHDLQSVWMS